MGRGWVVVLIIAVIVVLVAVTGRRSARGRRSTAGHYDADAIGGYVLDPATQSYRYELPNVARTGPQMAPGTGPPHRRRRRRRLRRPQPDGETHR